MSHSDVVPVDILRYFHGCLKIPNSIARSKTPIQEPRIERPVSNVEDLDWDLEIGRYAYTSTLLSLKNDGISIDHPKDKKLLNRLKEILKKLKSATLLPELPYEVNLVESEISNAVCYPGGSIIFFSGLFDLKGVVENALFCHPRESGDPELVENAGFLLSQE